MINKSLITNSLSITVLLLSFLDTAYRDILFNIGAFALSGSLTNNLAIYMLFEKIPFIYGSGVVQNNFEQFKSAIKSLIVGEFFNRNNITKLINNTQKHMNQNISPIVNLDKIFDEFVDVIETSSLAGMLAMVGGSKALEPLRSPIEKKFSKLISEIENTIRDKSAALVISDDLFADIEQLIDSRLQELTPMYVKEIVAKMIYNHLGWLVVWGGVVGAFVGLIVSLVR
ncbi:DUF445 domain-containing protein [Alphaproteobacteria bacterium]|nr:DUF445 domain-containing protein [Alphaproteobacteria bacterium]